MPVFAFCPLAGFALAHWKDYLVTYIQLTSNSPKLSAYFRGVARQMPQVLDDEVYKSTYAAQQLFFQTVETWQTKPTFEIKHEGTARWSVSTDDPRYRWIDEGTPARTITVRQAPFLVFKWPSSAKTRPSAIGSGPGYRGYYWASKKSVNYPGIRPRYFRRQIYQLAQGPTLAALREALRKAINQEAVGL